METRMSEKFNKVLYIVLSLLLAFLFWLYVDTENGSVIEETYYNIPIVFLGKDDTLPSRNLMLSEGEDITLDITLSGPRSVISDLNRGDIWAQVDLSRIYSAGPHTLTYSLILPDTVSRSSITEERSSRSSVTVHVAPLYSLDIPVSVSTEGSAAEGYMYMPEGLTYEPSVITLSGLEEDVDRVAGCRVVVDLSGAKGTVSQEFSYELVDAEGNPVKDDGIRASDRRIMVTAPVYVTKELPLKVKYLESAGSTLENADCRLDLDRITVAGEPASLENLEEISLGTVNLSDYIDDTEIDLEIKLPAGCINLTNDADHVTLSIRYHGLETRLIEGVTNISAIGLSESQKFDKITTSVNVVLRGPAEDLELVTAEDVRIVVDLKQYATAGTVREAGTVMVDGYNRVGAVGGNYQISGKIIT